MTSVSTPSRPTTAPILLEGVSLRYSRAEDVLSDVNLELNSGSFTFLTGPSGSGKTSLLRLMYMSLPPSEGKVALFGYPTRGLPREKRALLRRRVGVVFQDFRLLDHLSAYDNAALPLRVAGARDKDYRDDVVELLRWVGLGERIDAFPQTLSGGEKQRVAIARALVNKPDLLIADEPTGNVDPDMAERLMRLFLELNKRIGTTVFIASHDLGLVRRLRKPALRLENGLLMRDGAFGAAAE